jgi:hypothetical protein
MGNIALEFHKAYSMYSLGQLQSVNLFNLRKEVVRVGSDEMASLGAYDMYTLVHILRLGRVIRHCFSKWDNRWTYLDAAFCKSFS